jgi:uncharacterized protein YwgA
MNAEKRQQLRWSVLSEIVAQASGKLGRTAIMKLAYFLQTLKRVPLDYDFRLYTYGPFDSDVLNDVGQLESLGALKAELVYFPSGYGYEFSSGSKMHKVRKLTEDEGQKYQAELTWVLGEFGGKTAGELEVFSTIIFADQEAAEQRKPISQTDLARTVKEIKPKFTVEHILEHVQVLNEKGFLVGCKR